MSRRNITAAVCATVAGLAMGSLVEAARSSRNEDRGTTPARSTLDKELPNVVFWAWERREDLRFVDPARAGVAFLAKTIYLEPARGIPTSTSASFVVRPRLQPLRVAPSTPLMAVVRIENPAGFSTKTNITREARERLVSEVTGLAALSGVRAVQIDFDATTSEHPFYAALLQDVRSQLPPAVPLSITALASWCLGDSWLSQLPANTVDEAVPMLFRMGVDVSHVARFLESGAEFPVAVCRNSLGLSTDESFSRAVLTKAGSVRPLGSKRKRIYVFAPQAWTALEANAILREQRP
jgi:hypothetical protein